MRKLECVSCGWSCWTSRAQILKGRPSCSCGYGELDAVDPEIRAEYDPLAADELEAIAARRLGRRHASAPNGQGRKQRTCPACHKFTSSDHCGCGYDAVLGRYAGASGGAGMPF
jgi:hypothetical protein